MHLPYSNVDVSPSLFAKRKTLRCPSTRSSRLLSVALWLVLSLCLVSVANAAGAAASFISFSDRLTLDALQKGNGHVSEEMLKAHAEILFKYLEGEPTPKERRVIRNETKLRWETIKNDEIAIYVGYDNGLITRGYLFRFKRDAGRLISTTVVLGE